MKRLKLVAIFSVAGALLFPSVGSAQPAASQTIGGVSRQEENLDRSKKIETRLDKGVAAKQEAAAPGVEMPEAGPKVLITKINVEGADALSAADVRAVVSQYEGRELSLRDAQQVADRITDLYRQKGMVTSRAYLPPQSLKEGTLLIKVIVGKVGDVNVSGNKYFKTSLLKDRIELKPGGYFDYSALQRALVYINEHPDRNARAVLTPGQVPGTTDVVVDVKDRLPVHVGVAYDNYGSRFINKSRYTTTVEHNNITGHDDKFLWKFQRSEANYLRLYQGRYSLPLTSTSDIGGYFVANEIELGKEFEDVESRGKAHIYGIFFNKVLTQKADLDVRFSTGFDYKSVVNFLSGNKNSRDELRVLKAGLDFDFTDKLGRNIVSAEYDAGFPEIFGGMENKDPMASRIGAGAKFQKGMFTYYRLHPMPLSSTLLWKNIAQYTNHALVASEQFQIGGPASVRGYTPAENSGDRGYYTSLELSFPLYGLPKDISVPFRKERLWDSLRLVTFWDAATVNVKNLASGEDENTYLQGYGVGVRFNVKDITARFELGYPFGDNKPSDGRYAHPWVELTYKF